MAVDTEVEVLKDEVMAAEEISADEKCTTLLVPSAEGIVKFRFGRVKIDRYTAVTVLKKGKMRTEIPEDLIWAVKKEIEAETVDNFQSK